jgi:hypothetical protein
MRTVIRAIVATFISATLLGCEPMPAAPAAAGGRTSAAMSDAAGRAMVRTELVFGLTRDDGSAVDEMEWQNFVDSAIAAWFPAGFTIIEADGRWRGTAGKIATERSKVLVIYHDGSEANLRKLDELRRIYCQRFGRQTVIRASGNVWVAF